MRKNMGKICLWKIPAILAVLCLALAFASCDNGTTGDDGTNGGYDGGGATPSGGGLTITGIPAGFNGRYAEFYLGLDGGVGANVCFEKESFISLRISGNSVTLPIVLDICEDDLEVIWFSGNETFTPGGSLFIRYLCISECPYIGGGGVSIIALRTWLDPITFTNGNATIAWADGVCGGGVNLCCYGVGGNTTP